MTNYIVENGHLKKVLTNESILNLPNNVEIIDSMAINKLPTVIMINIPNSVKIIEKFAISQMINLTKIGTLPVDDLTVDGIIKTGAIIDCDRLKSIKLPDSIKEIQDKAIVVKSDLTEVIMPKKVEIISLGCIQQEENLTVDLPSTVKTIVYSKCKAITYNIMNDNYKLINGMIFDKDNTLIYHNNVDKCVLPKNISSWTLGCLRTFNGEVVSENENIIIANGAIIIGDETIDYYGNKLTLYTKFNNQTINEVKLDYLGIRTDTDLTGLTGAVKVVNLKEGINLNPKALSCLDVKFIQYGKIRISTKAIEMMSKELSIQFNKETYNNILTVLKFEDISDEDLKFWLAFSEQYSYELYLRLSKLLIENMKKTAQDCGEDITDLENLEIGAY